MLVVVVDDEETRLTLTRANSDIPSLLPLQQHHDVPPGSRRDCAVRAALLHPVR